LESEGAEALARSANLGQLRSLDLSRNGIDDKGARALARSKGLPELTGLCLSRNRITNRAFAVLLDWRAPTGQWARFEAWGNSFAAGRAMQLERKGVRR
jgi:hypothetical protein